MVLRTLWDSQQLHLAGLKTVMDELERALQDDPYVRALVSPRVASMFADLSILAECRHQVSLYQPWASMLEHQAAQHRDDYLQRTRALQELLGDFSAASVVAASDVSNGRFHYPVDKRKTRENTEAMQAAERNLDEFWGKVDSQLAIKTRLHKHPALRNLLSEQRILR